jgi:hypothetical protein
MKNKGGSMTIEEQLNQKQAEVHFLQMRLKNQVRLVMKIKEWLKMELDIDWLPPKTKKDALEDMASDDPLCYGRYECAKGLLEFINDEQKRSK